MFLISALPILIIFLGGYFLMKLRFFFILHPIKTVRKIKKAVSRKEARRALSLALAGTLGVGNIVGVAYGISVGGPGCLFWIFVSSLFASVIKYAESTLCADSLKSGHGAMMYVMEGAFKKIGGVLGVLYALLCLLLSFTMGTSLQVGSVVTSLHGNVSKYGDTAALVFFVFVFVTVVGGVKKIENVTSKLIPLSTIIYIILCLGIIFSNLSSLPTVMTRIMREAFGYRSAACGISLHIAINSMKEGFARGLLSNEAGAGTSAMAGTRADTEMQSEAGLFGICEVFFDTQLLCILTGLAVLTSPVSLVGGSGIGIVLSAVFSVYGSFGAYLLFGLLFAFAFSTVICWYYYGSTSAGYLFGKRSGIPYTLLFLLATLLGYKIPSELLIISSDVLLFFMTLLTAITLIKKSERIFHLSEKLLKNSDV